MKIIKEKNLITQCNQWDLILTGFFIPRKGCPPGQKTLLLFSFAGLFYLYGGYDKENYALKRPLRDP